jgi:DNA modification methylase
MTWILHRHDARHISDLLEPNSVDLIVTSPPYFALRSYRDGGEHYDGQLGSEATPAEFVDNLIACTADWLKVLKPSGSLFVNLGDKYAGSGGHNNSGISTHGAGKSTLQRNRVHSTIADSPDLARRQALAEELRATRRNAPDRYNQASDGIPAKSRMALPWRYAIRCIDELGLILRADIVWSKPNGLPESVTDRVRMSHEYLFHFTRQGRYFAAIDEVREGYAPGTAERYTYGFIHGKAHALGETQNPAMRADNGGPDSTNPLGKVPGSVWTMPSEPLVVPDHLGVDHFAAFPSELPRRCILGWTPSGWCTVCGEARRPVVEKTKVLDHASPGMVGAYRDASEPDGNDRGINGSKGVYRSEAITGYRCACPTPDAPTRPAVVLDPFAGTGTTPAVAHHLGRHGVGVDLSSDYLRLAAWRCRHDRSLWAKTAERSGMPAPPVVDGQLALFSEGGVP